MTAVPASPASSPFAQAGPGLIAMGYSPLSILPADHPHRAAGKAPANLMGGSWRPTEGWQALRTAPLTGFPLRLALNAPGRPNIGIVMGTPAGPNAAGAPTYVVAVDVDTQDPEAFDAILRALPASPMKKKGAKGLTAFYRATDAIKSRSFDDHRIPRGSGQSRRLLDLLTGFATKQTIIPPSIHPETRQPYVWLSGPVPACDLPELTEDALAALIETLEMHGFDPNAGRAEGEERKPFDPADHDADDPFERAKVAAMANLSAWVPHLDNLHGLRPARGGYEAVDLTRDSSSGRPTEKRKRNLSIQSAGIKDFGTNETFSAIDLVMRLNGLTESGALGWLEDRLGLSDDSIVVDVAALTAAHDDKDLPEPLRRKGITTDDTPGRSSSGNHPKMPATTAFEGGRADEVTPRIVASPSSQELPDDLIDCPGLVGEIAAWIGRTAQRPLPAANLLAAISIVGTAAGRRFAGPTESSLVIYGLALAPSGSGKAHPIVASEFLLRKAGLGRMVAPSSWMSGSALVQHLGRQPVCVSYADEVGEFFAKLNGAKSSTHERAVSGVLRQLFGTNWGSYTTPGWAASNTAATTPPVIHAPAYSFIGFSVPEAVWDAMQGADVTNGFMNRFLLLPTGQAGVECDEPESIFDIPESLIAPLQAISQAGGPLASATMHVDMASEPLVRVPWEGGAGSDAALLFKDLRRECREHPQGEHLMKRTAEIAVRLATIRAIGRAGQRASVSLADMAWGRDLALYSAKRMIADAAAYMSETEWQAKAKFVLRCIADAPCRSITRAALCKKVAHRFPARDLDALIKGLIESQEVADNSSRAGRRGPEALTYVAL